MHELDYYNCNDTAHTEIYTLSLHDALPIFEHALLVEVIRKAAEIQRRLPAGASAPAEDRKSTRLNSSHMSISYAVFCLKKKIFTQYSLRPLPLIALRLHSSQHN